MITVIEVIAKIAWNFWPLLVAGGVCAVILWRASK